MAHCWFVDPETGEWSILPLDAAAVEIGAALWHPSRQAGGPPEALLLRSQTAAGEQWLIVNLMLRPLAINGERLETGIRVLSDKDEIYLVGVGRLFYSTEQLSRTESFAGSDRPLLCPRCREPLFVARPIVRCACGVAYHNDPELDRRCYDYASACALCRAPTELSETFRWQPSEL